MRRGKQFNYLFFHSKPVWWVIYVGTFEKQILIHEKSLSEYTVHPHVQLDQLT